MWTDEAQIPKNADVPAKSCAQCNHSPAFRRARKRVNNGVPPNPGKRDVCKSPQTPTFGHSQMLVRFYTNGLLTVFYLCKTDPTVSFINRPLQTAFCRNGVHELVLGPKLWVGDLGLAQIPIETDFMSSTWKKSTVKTVNN